MTYHSRTIHLLASPAVGLSAQELGALNREPIHRLPPEPRGFGLWGETGNGKTWALVRVAADLVESRVRLSGEPGALLLPEGFLTWANWPEQANVLKRRALSCDHWISRVKEGRYLFLDDLGGEVIRSEDDFALGILREVLDARYRAGKATWWTSNLSPEGLVETYKSRLASRLLSAWKPYRVEGGDLRLGGPAALPPPVRQPNVQDFRLRAAGSDL